MPVGQKSLMKEVEDITAGTVTGSKGCPDPFAPATPRFTASSLGNSAIDHHKPNCLFRNVVGGLDVRRRDEFKVCFSPFEGSFGHTEERVQIGAEAPRPEPATLFLMTRLVDVDHLFARQQRQELFVSMVQRSGYLADQFAEAWYLPKLLFRA